MKPGSKLSDVLLVQYHGSYPEGDPADFPGAIRGVQGYKGEMTGMCRKSACAGYFCAEFTKMVVFFMNSCIMILQIIFKIIFKT